MRPMRLLATGLLAVGILGIASCVSDCNHAGVTRSNSRGELAHPTANSSEALAALQPIGRVPADTTRRKMVSIGRNLAIADGRPQALEVMLVNTSGETLTYYARRDPALPIARVEVLKSGVWNQSPLEIIFCGTGLSPRKYKLDPGESRIAYLPVVSLHEPIRFTIEVSPGADRKRTQPVSLEWSATE